MSIRLTIDNSYSRIEGLTSSQFKDVKSILSYNIDAQAAYFSNSFRSTKRYLIDAAGNFPTGLLQLVKSYLIDKTFEICDKRRLPASTMHFNMDLGLLPYDEQIMAVEACLARFRGTVVACTGFGKSVTIAMLINALKVKTLIVVPNLGLKQQLKASLTKYFGNLRNITVENVDSPALQKPGDYDCLIIDEAHHVAAKTYRLLNKKYWNNIYYRFFFTATPFRSKNEEQLLFESVAGQVIYDVPYAKAEERGYVLPLEAYYIEVPKKTNILGHTWSQIYSELVTNNLVRNGIIAGTLGSLTKNKKAVLCLVKEIAHGEHLRRIVESYSGLEIPFIKGENEDNAQVLSKFNSKALNSLIGTVGVLGEGVDTKPAEFVIIAGLGKSKGQFMQQVGRALRVGNGKDSAKIIIFKDISHKYTLRHFKEQCKILKEEYGVVAVKLDI